MIRLRTLVTAAAAGCLTVAIGRAQPPPGGKMPAAMQTKMKAWQKWRKTHQGITALEQTMRGVEMMERDKKTRLSKSQAKTVVSLLKTWRHKAVMTNAQALQVNKRITSTFTVPQLKQIALGASAAKRGQGGPGGMGGPPPGGMGGPPPGGMGGPPPGGPPPGGMGGPPPGGPGGPPPGGGAFPNPKDYNPLNPDSLPFPPERQRTQWMLDNLTRDLTARVR